MRDGTSAARSILNCTASRLDTREYFNVPIWRTKYVPPQHAFSTAPDCSLNGIFVIELT